MTNNQQSTINNLQSPIHLGLIGWPLSHSLSPRLHNAALHALDLPGEYRLYPVPHLPAGRDLLAETLHRLRPPLGARLPGSYDPSVHQLNGLSVTIPHKQSVLPHLDKLTPAAQAIGAVNTIYLRHDLLTGDNTDAHGFLVDLQRVFPQLFVAQSHLKDRPVRALVLGAGGAARAVVYALHSAGFEITVAARRVEQGNELSVISNRLSVISLASLPAHCSLTIDYRLVVNTTPLGMLPDAGSSPWPNDLPFPPGACVYDLVYKPAETTLVSQARQAGIPAITGLGMLVEQAVLAFELWTGQAPPPEVMWNAVAEFLPASQSKSKMP